MMYTVIKGTKTVKEFKEFKIYLEQRARDLYEEHKSHWDTWQFGDIDKVWIDNDGFICIQYKSGDWWHYNDLGEWW